MVRKRCIAGVAALAASMGFLAAASTAEAETVSYNFTGSGGSQSSYTFEPVGGGTPTVHVTGLEDGASRNVYQSGSGLGVVGATDHLLGFGTDFLKKRLDGAGSTESLIFDFTPTEVTLNTIAFNLVDDTFLTPGDTVSISVASLDNVIWTGEVLISFWAIGASIDLDLAELGLSAAQRTGLSFGLSSPGLDDGVAIGGLTASYSLGSVVTPVPTPSAVCGGMALVGLIGLRRRHAA